MGGAAPAAAARHGARSAGADVAGAVEPAGARGAARLFQAHHGGLPRRCVEAAGHAGPGGRERRGSQARGPAAHGLHAHRRTARAGGLRTPRGAARRDRPGRGGRRGAVRRNQRPSLSLLPGAPAVAARGPVRGHARSRPAAGSWSGSGTASAPNWCGVRVPPGSGRAARSWSATAFPNCSAWARRPCRTVPCSMARSSSGSMRRAMRRHGCVRSRTCRNASAARRSAPKAAARAARGAAGLRPAGRGREGSAGAAAA